MSKEEIQSFIDFKNSVKSENRGGVIMYDVPKHYKWLTESELFEHYLQSKNKQQ